MGKCFLVVAVKEMWNRKTEKNMNWGILLVSGTNLSHEINRKLNCSVTNILQNVLFCVKQMGLERHVSEYIFRENFHFWVDCPFKNGL